MSYEELKAYLLVSEMCFECYGNNYYIEQTANGYAGAPCSDNMRLIEYPSFDELLDNFMVGDRTLRASMADIADW